MTVRLRETGRFDEISVGLQQQRQQGIFPLVIRASTFHYSRMLVRPLRERLLLPRLALLRLVRRLNDALLGAHHGGELLTRLGNASPLLGIAVHLLVVLVVVFIALRV